MDKFISKMIKVYLLDRFLVAVLSNCLNQVEIEIESQFKLRIENHSRPFHSRFYVFRTTASYYAQKVYMT